MNRMQARLDVAKALRQLHDPLLLAESPLVRLLRIEPGVPELAGEELRVRLGEASGRVIARLVGEGRTQQRRSLLEAVLAGSSVAAWAGRAGLSREHVCRTFWVEVTAMVTRELLPSGRRSGSRSVPPRTRATGARAKI